MSKKDDIIWGQWNSVRSITIYIYLLKWFSPIFFKIVLFLVKFQNVRVTRHYFIKFLPYKIPPTTMFLIFFWIVLLWFWFQKNQFYSENNKYVNKYINLKKWFLGKWFLSHVISTYLINFILLDNVSMREGIQIFCKGINHESSESLANFYY